MALQTDHFTQRYEQVAQRLLDDLRAGLWVAPEKLPGERALALRMGVSRATVREALGALQVAGVIETRQGAGSFVVEVPSAAELPAAADAGPAAVLQARLVLEPQVAALAAGRADAEIEELLEVMAASDDPTDPEQRARWSDADRAFHRRFAHLTGNPVLATMADHLADLMDQPLWRRLRDDSIAVPGRTALQLAEHRLIAAAVAEGDAEAATFHATQHITRARRYMALD